MRSLKIVALFAVLNTGAWLIPQEASAQQVTVSFQLFYDELSPYGSWTDYPNYGYVWIPDEDPGFSPYATDGHWVFTDYGWTWVSDYPWGWAPFHYGRWDYDDNYGWFWVPDDEWGPAWVSWRRAPGYYGWAPLRPGISISFAFGKDYHERNERWTFVGERDIASSDVGRRYVNRSNNVTIINNSTVIVNTRRDNGRNATYIAGPDRDDVQRVTRTTVESVVIRENDRPGHHLGNGELQIYRPRVQKRSGSAQNPAPSKVMRLNDLKPASERTAGRRQQQSRTINAPERGQQQQGQDIKLPNRDQQQKQDVKSANRSQQQQKQDLKPPNKGQQKQRQDVKPSNDKGKRQQPANVTVPDRNRKAQSSQAKTNKNEKDKKDKKDQGGQQ